MALAPGFRIGPYEIVSPLGAGGMGEVYRAKDTRLGRDVAVKVLPESHARNDEAEARFEREARAVAALSHPNILAIHDVGREGNIAYAVMELLEGETLRGRMKDGPLPIQKAVEFAGQMAQGLAAAHERGIVHRDLKPENVFVTTGGIVKILDFGLARQMAPANQEGTHSPTVSKLTEPGSVAGTVGYMSPEQVRAAAADHRSDVFSFACVLYEMLAGRRPFRKETSAETMTAILREEPEPLSTHRNDIPPLLEQIVHHGLEKKPEDRFQSMRDIAFNLKAISTASRSGVVPAVSAAPRHRVAQPAIWALFALAGAAVAWLAASHFATAPALPRFEKLTFEAGAIFSARFAPDGHTVLYGAAWRGDPISLFSTRLDAAGSRPLGIEADILALSPSGEMALSLDRTTLTSMMTVGRLASASLGGGAPREILDGVLDADWSPDGKRLAVTREVEGEARLEYPIGKVLQRGAGYFSSPRISPEGDAVAFVRHQVKGDDRGVVAISDLEGNVRAITPDLPSINGLAWPPGSDEIWMSAWTPPGGYTIQAISLDGRARTIFRSGARIKLFDARGGRALVGFENAHSGVSGRLRGDDRERDLSYLDGTCAMDLSEDGSKMLFAEGWVGGGPGYSFYLGEIGGGPPVRLGTGWGTDLSPDEKWTLSYSVDPPMKLTITPTGPGTPRVIDLPEFDAVGGANWFPDGGQILLWASEKEGNFRTFVLDLPDGRPRAITAPGASPRAFAFAAHVVSPDARYAAMTGPEGIPMLFPIDGGDPAPLPGALKGDDPVGWSGDGKTLIVLTKGVNPNRVYRIDVASGRREIYKELIPPDPAGVLEILGFVTTPDLQFYAYTYLKVLTDLYIVDGLK